MGLVFFSDTNENTFILWLMDQSRVEETVQNLTRWCTLWQKILKKSNSKTIPTTKVRQQSHIMADATPVMYKSFEKLLSNNFQVIICERMAKNCFKVNILSKICWNICFSIKKVIIFYFLYIHELDHLMIITIYYHYLNF